MENISKIIKQKRIEKSWSQEELANKSSLNLRTIQRIENQETVPRPTTLTLLYDALDINKSEVIEKSNQKSHVLKITVDILFLIIINLLLMFLIGFLTLDSFANLNSFVGGFFVSFTIPYIIVSKTLEISSFERLIKYGSGYIIYFILLLALHGFEQGFFAGMNHGLFPCLLISVLMLYYGDQLFQKNKKE